MIEKYLKNLGIKSKIAARNLNKVDIKYKNKTLETYSKELNKNKKKIIRENIKDLKNFKNGKIIDSIILNGRVI